MTHDGPQTLSQTRWHKFLLCAALAVSSACGSESSVDESAARGVVVVNAPAAGVVRRVIAREGMTVNEGAPIVEIAVVTEGPPASTPSPGESAEARAAGNFKAADAEIEAARAEVVRHDAEVRRLTPLVASGEAPQAQLDGERALYERAQQRLQQAQDAKQRAEGELRAARSQPTTSAAQPPPPREQLMTAVASSAGTVSVVSVRVGDRVKAGQPVATLRAND